MPEELGCIINKLENVKSKKYGDFEIFSGIWTNTSQKKISLSVAWSGWGKVSSARATTRLISTLEETQKIDLLIFTGVAGSVDKKLKQWDIVISEAVIQHDMDARPLFEKFVIPIINKKKISADKNLVEHFYTSLKKNIYKESTSIFGSIYKGLIATGDMFISDKEKLKQLSYEIPDLLAVEMEGGAFAQVAYQENINWIVTRVISDGADDDANDEFKSFLLKYESKSWELIKYLFNSL